MIVSELVTLRAQYGGKCKCGTHFRAGENVGWNPATRKVDKCLACLPVKPTNVTSLSTYHKQRDELPPSNSMTDADWEFMDTDPYWNLDR